jgi:DNA polymerase
MPRVIDPDERLRARQRLALRAERAFGVDSVRLPAEARAPDGPAPVPPGACATPATRPQPQEVVSSNLFGETLAQGSLQAPSPVGTLDSPELSVDEKRLRLAELDANEVRGCTRCRLCERRTQTVFGEGAPDARLFFIGEGPGETEDRTGRPFVGKAGEKLNEMIRAMGLRREDVYIANVVKCRPPGNREPAADEVATCTPYLERQLEIVRPRVIVTLGRPATQHMLNTKNSMSRMRGQWHEWRGIKLMPTFHPAYLLRSYTRENREMVWSDLQQVMRELGLPIGKRSGA